MAAFIKIASDHIKIEVNPFGAELSSLKDGQGNQYLWQADPAFWGKRAPILFPIVGRTPGDRLTLPSGSFPMPKHGFARQSMFQLIEHTHASCAF